MNHSHTHDYVVFSFDKDLAVTGLNYRFLFQTSFLVSILSNHLKRYSNLSLNPAGGKSIWKSTYGPKNIDLIR